MAENPCKSSFLCLICARSHDQKQVMRLETNPATSDAVAIGWSARAELAAALIFTAAHTAAVARRAEESTVA